jgi:chromosome segregation ATPase
LLGGVVVIESVLFFVLGALAAGLLALLLLPSLNARAIRLAVRKLERTLPLTLADVAAVKDAVRAEMAAKMARGDFERARVGRALTEAQTELAVVRSRLAMLEIEKSAFASTLSDYETRLDLAHEETRAAIEGGARSDAERRELERRLAAEAQVSSQAEFRFSEAETQAAEMKMALVEAEARIASLSEAIADLTSERPVSGMTAEPPSAPVIHVDFAARQERAAVDAPLLSPDDESRRIDELARRLKILRARNVAMRQRADVPEAKSDNDGI